MTGDYGDSIIIGLVQGLTEFLPISSSGHLVLVKGIISARDVSLTFDVFVHFATLLAVCTLFRRDVAAMISAFFKTLAFARRKSLLHAYHQDQYFRLSFFVIIGTIPAAFAGYVWNESVKQIFNAPGAVSLLLVVTGLILLSTRWTPRDRTSLTTWRSFLIGVAQSVALLPGISRSGTTISAALWLRVEPELAARFSFILAIPAIIGAVLFEFVSLPAGILQEDIPALVIGGMTAYVSGAVAISLVMKIIARGRFFWFGIYCIIVGVSSVIFIR